MTNAFMNIAGNITSTEAFEVLKNEKDSFLVDVRSMVEWAFVGLPDLKNISKDIIKISWLNFPTWEINKNFLLELEKNIPDRNSKIFFICKSGGRSFDAAEAVAKNLGYKNCYNISDGFEGAINENSQRGKIDGWKAHNLPWVQG